MRPTVTPVHAAAPLTHGQAPDRRHCARPCERAVTPAITGSRTVGPVRALTVRRSVVSAYEAVEPGPLFAMHRTTPDQGCVVGHGIQPAMQGVYEGIEESLRHELARVTLENLLRDVLERR
ncbi:hypothetical protein ABH941_001041 [Streptacidiphilus sp. EB103A]